MELRTEVWVDSVQCEFDRHRVWFEAGERRTIEHAYPGPFHYFAKYLIVTITH